MRNQRPLLSLLIASTIVAAIAAQTMDIKPAPRPPAPKPGAPTDASAAPDGYAPTPQWLGQTRAPYPAKRVAYEVKTLAEGLQGAFSFAFLPNGCMIAAERGGRLRVLDANLKLSPPLEGLPANLFARGGQGLFEVRPDRAFAQNRTLYLTYTVLPDGVDPAAVSGAGVLVVASARLSDDQTRIDNLRVLLNAEGTNGRVIQAPDGTLLVTSTVPSGLNLSAMDWQQPQAFDSNMGKVLRIHTDGSIPKDNPFVGRGGAHAEIYALGFRDSQGLAINPRTGVLWTSEHGPRGGDEINAVHKGKNYGFPLVGYGRDYSGKPINNDRTAQEGLEQPVYFWTPDIAPAGIAFYTGKLFPAWHGDLFVASLVGKSLVHLVLNGERVVAEERLLTELNARIRGVVDGPDGALYVLTDGPTGKILRVTPKK
jgi:glucose/arabinose dehydrogenase